MPTQIPILNLTRQYELLSNEINEALLKVAASGYYILGPNVSAFESEMANYLGVNHVIGCANGTDALYLALKALRVGHGDEVITTPFSYMATSESIVRAGAIPVFVDIDADTMNIDASQVEKAITKKTKAILPVHIFGQVAEMDTIQALAEQYKLYVVEDAAQAIGSSYYSEYNSIAIKAGTIGNIGCFSFFPTKNLGAFGDGGMCVTNDDGLADRLRMLRVHGSKKRYYHDEQGLNSRLDEIQAAVLRLKLPHLNQWNNARKQLAEGYTRYLKEFSSVLKTPVCLAHNTHIYHQYTLQIQSEQPEESRQVFQQTMQDNGVQTMIYYPLALYRQKTHDSLGIDPKHFPVCEMICNQVISLPIFPELSLEEQETVFKALAQSTEKISLTASLP
ncbi:MAG: DegT/DnrJ/EryC1/StrS family aminotransferase [Cyanobacteria bacterium P01_H01_bin.74]